ncbi:MAG: hypothetical protein JEZ00_11540 [Anaerolineaceae bacterium]|nr:hypothetical protein [Anaerolineaceae bacterium]
MPRRDAFTDLRTTQDTSELDKNASKNVMNENRQPLDLIPTAGVRKKRSRNWERAHRNETATYRGIPQPVLELIMEISQSLSVPRDEVVRVFLEYGISQYRAEQLKIYAYPKAQRMTLFPDHGQTAQIIVREKIDNNLWLKDAFPIPGKKNSISKRKKHKNNQQAKPQWEMRVTFRIPSLLKEEVRTIAREHTVPVGEIVSFFILHGSKAFHDGRLLLQPSPKMIGKTLFQE